jgi:DNA-binding MarR family transcriptional regulator
VTDPLADELLEDLNGLRRVVRRLLRPRLADPALTASQVELLRVVEASPGTGVAAAARAMHLAGNSVSALVYQLVDAGYLRRETDPADRRAAQLHLTPAAHSRLDAWRSGRSELVGDGLARLSAAERATIARALPALRRLATVLSTMDEAEPGEPSRVVAHG